jgi:hypothetical protein
MLVSTRRSAIRPLTIPVTPQEDIDALRARIATLRSGGRHG